ncbi:MAG: imidazoleglycerol-phosphate dehydratase HisB [Lentisphaerales bacterium]|jgi:imidazoleglycerol-phosphate dehydratase|nr:MAG: imidazoleglycerol-phosphate dehydratase HisB [Lentisphaerales bacterium]
MKKRSASVRRKTRETDISVELVLDGTGKARIDTGIAFLNHMLELFSKHSLVDLAIKARGDLAVDYHHTVEDIGLVMGDAFDKALGSRKGIVRYGWCVIPMDDAASRAAVDLGGRPYLVLQMANRKRKIGDFDLGLLREFLQAFSVKARVNLHIAQLYGAEAHHAYESAFKAFARAMRMACEKDPRAKGVPSSKGRI